MGIDDDNSLLGSTMSIVEDGSALPNVSGDDDLIADRSQSHEKPEYNIN